MLVAWVVAALSAALPLAAADPPVRFTPAARELPVPNARDVYLEAVALLKPADELGLHPYTPAWAPAEGEDRFLDDPRLGDRDEYVAANAAALAKLREGLPLAYGEPFLDDFDTPLPHYAQYRELARLLTMEAQLQAAAGDWPAAFASCLDALEFGTDVPRGGPIIGFLVGLAVQATAREPMRDILAEMTPEECAAALPRLRAIVAGQPTYAEALASERDMSLAAAARLLNELPRNPDGLAVLGLEDPEKVRLILGLAQMPRQQVFDGLVAEYDRFVVAATAQPEPLPMPEPDHPLARALLPALFKARATADQKALESRKLLLRVALEASGWGR